eukprot:1764165-Amphidinium_carterae.1
MPLVPHDETCIHVHLDARTTSMRHFHAGGKRVFSLLSAWLKQASTCRVAYEKDCDRIPALLTKAAQSI